MAPSHSGWQPQWPSMHGTPSSQQAPPQASNRHLHEPPVHWAAPGQGPSQGAPHPSSCPQSFPAQLGWQTHAPPTHTWPWGQHFPLHICVVQRQTPPTHVSPSTGQEPALHFPPQPSAAPQVLPAQAGMHGIAHSPSMQASFRLQHTPSQEAYAHWQVPPAHFSLEPGQGPSQRP